MPRLKFICGLLALALLAPAARAATPPPSRPVVKLLPIPPVGPSPITPDCRYLFVVDTSSAMQRYADGLYRTTHRLIINGLGGRMQDGDVFTIWTYADTVLTREFPLNAWTPDLNIALANRAYEFLAQQKFRGKSNLRPVFAEMSQALAIATNLTIIIVSDGTDVIVGTPFDRPINVTYGKRASEMRSAKMPFLTSLVTQRGEFTHWSVRGGLEDIGLPFPEKPPVPVTLASVPEPAPPKPTPIPVITNTAPPVASVPKPVVPASPPPVVATTLPKAPAPTATPPATNALAAKPPEPVVPKPSPAPPPVSATAPKPATNAVAIATPPPAPVPAVTTVKKTEPVLATTPPLKKPDPGAPLPAPRQEAKAALPPPPKPVVETPKPPAPAPKPVVTVIPTNSPAPPAPKPVAPKPKEELVLPAIPPALQPIVPPAQRPPKSVVDASNALARVELLRPPAGTSAPPANPLAARIIETKPAPKPTNTTVMVTKPAPPPATNPPVVKPATNAVVVAKTTPIVPPPATTAKSPPPKAIEPKASDPKPPAPVTNATTRPVSPPQAAVLPLPTRDVRNEGKSIAAVMTSATAAPKLTPPAAKKDVPMSETKASPAQPPKPAGQLAVASRGAPTGGWGYLAAAVLLLVVAGSIIASLLRPRPHPSAISQSLDDNRV